MSIRVMTRVWDNSPAEGIELLVLLCLADHANDKDEAWPSIPTIAQRSRQSERNVRRILRRLEKIGEITSIGKRGPRGDRKSTVYRILTSSEPLPVERPDNLAARGGAERPDTAMSGRTNSTGSEATTGQTGPVFASRPDTAVSAKPLVTDEPPVTDDPSDAADKPRRPWNQRACEIWQNRFEGTVPGARITNALRSLVTMYGDDQVLERWATYLRDEDPRFATPETFANKYGSITGESNGNKNGRATAGRSAGKTPPVKPGSNRYDRNLEGLIPSP